MVRSDFHRHYHRDAHSTDGDPPSDLSFFCHPYWMDIDSSLFAGFSSVCWPLSRSGLSSLSQRFPCPSAPEGFPISRRFGGRPNLRPFLLNEDPRIPLQYARYTVFLGLDINWGPPYKGRAQGGIARPGKYCISRAEALSISSSSLRDLARLASRTKHRHPAETPPASAYPVASNRVGYPLGGASMEFAERLRPPPQPKRRSGLTLAGCMRHHHGHRHRH